MQKLLSQWSHNGSLCINALRAVRGGNELPPRSSSSEPAQQTMHLFIGGIGWEFHPTRLPYSPCIPERHIPCFRNIKNTPFRYDHIVHENQRIPSITQRITQRAQTVFKQLPSCMGACMGALSSSHNMMIFSLEAESGPGMISSGHASRTSLVKGPPQVKLRFN